MAAYELESPIDGIVWDNIVNDWDNETDEPKEIFEWWFVTEWLAEKLTEYDEPVMAYDNGFIWGRTTTGMAIAHDTPMVYIARDLHKGDK